MNSRSACLLAVLCLIAALSACSSAGNPTGHADGSVGGSGGGAGATDGSASDRPSGTDASAVDRSTGTDASATDRPGGTDVSAADRANGSDVSDGAVPMNATEVCRAAVRVQAQRWIACEGISMEENLGLANACPDYYFNADSNRTAADIAACVGTLAAQTCTDLALRTLPACRPTGKRPGGAGCAYNSQCQSGLCGSVGKTCGTCGRVGLPAGSPCTTYYDCQTGTFCHGKTLTCTDVSTITYGKQGEACDLSATPVVGCVGDLHCVPASSGSTAGACRPLPGAGEPCWYSGSGVMMCAAGNTCVAGTGNGTCTPATCGAGPPCDDASSYCGSADGGLGCLPRPTVGQSCSGKPCLAPAVCVANICTMPRAWGETCDSANPCIDGLLCTAGTCAPLGSANCPAYPGDGGAG